MFLQKFQDDIVALETKLDEKEEELERQRKLYDELQNARQSQQHADMSVGTGTGNMVRIMILLNLDMIVM